MEWDTACPILLIEVFDYLSTEIQETDINVGPTASTNKISINESLISDVLGPGEALDPNSFKELCCV